MKITVIGCGRWGSFIAWYLNQCGHQITLYGRKTSKNMQQFLQQRRNSLIELPDAVALSTELSCIQDAQIIVISVNVQGLQGLMDEIAAFHIHDKIFILCMKGLEIATGRRPSQIARENLTADNEVAVWLGPGHVQEFSQGIPNCMVIDSESPKTQKVLIDAFSSELIRFYYGEDLLGNEVGAASKNVIGIAAGILDGLHLSTLKGALMSRGTREIARLIVAMGGNELSVYGLCHLGDYQATVFSQLSQNRQFGEKLMRGENYDQLAEGYYTAKAIVELGRKYGVELPICETVYEILYNNGDAVKLMGELFNRSLKCEFKK